MHCNRNHRDEQNASAKWKTIKVRLEVALTLYCKRNGQGKQISDICKSQQSATEVALNLYY